MKQIISSSLDNNVFAWNFTPQSKPQKFIGHKSSVLSVAINPTGVLIASGSKDMTIRLWDNKVLNGKFNILKGHYGSVRKVNFSNDGSFLVSASDDKTIKIWSVN